MSYDFSRNLHSFLYVSGNIVNSKSGLAQLCEDVLQANCDDPSAEESDECLDVQGPINEAEGRDYEAENFNESGSISTLLESKRFCIF